MKTQNAKNFTERLDSENIKWTEMENNGGRDRIRLLYGGDNKDPIVLHFLFDDDEETMSVRCFDLCSCPKNRKAKMLIALNRINAKYKWVNFYMDNDNDIIAQVDMEVDPETVGKTGRRTISICVSVIDDVWPELQEALK
ncbi:MAG: YbjN domain-containing protein [Butyricicoccaceae bacterium]